jgi:ankyrin repeat protein
MNIATTMYTLFLCSFSFLHGMEPTTPKISDEELQIVIAEVNKSSLNIVNAIKKNAHQKKIKLIPQNLTSVFKLTQQQLDNMFLDNIENDTMRPLFISMGANINVRTSEGRNCLWGIKDQDLLNELIKYGADVNAIDNNEETPLSYLLQSPFTTCKEVTAARIFVDHKASLTIEAKSTALLLHRIMDYTDTKVRLSATTFLCQSKMNLNNGNPLVAAIKKELTPIVSCLLLWEAEANTPDKNGEYPLHVAIEQENCCYNRPTRQIIPEIIKQLLHYKANPNQPYNNEKTMPLHIAVKRHDPEIIKLLIHYGADKKALDKNNKTAYKLAKEQKHCSPKYKYSEEILNLLKCEKQKK